MITSKRYAAAADQLRQLRTMIDQYVRSHWRAAFHADIAKRQQLGQRLIAAQPPAARLDFTMTQFHAMVDRAFANQATPELPDSLARLDGHHGA